MTMYSKKTLPEVMVRRIGPCNRSIVLQSFHLYMSEDEISGINDTVSIVSWELCIGGLGLHISEI